MRTTKGSWSKAPPLSGDVCDELEREEEASGAVFGTSSGCEGLPVTMGLDLRGTGGAPTDAAIARGCF
jgi:hypothetical protein